jgi:hypothetical protein
MITTTTGYLVSYSIHLPTFLFNFFAIAADVFGLFATVAWLFSSNATLFYR